MTMGIGIFIESSNIPQEVCQSRSAPAECVGEDRSEKLDKTLTGGKGCGNGRLRRNYSCSKLACHMYWLQVQQAFACIMKLL